MERRAQNVANLLGSLEPSEGTRIYPISQDYCLTYLHEVNLWFGVKWPGMLETRWPMPAKAELEAGITYDH